MSRSALKTLTKGALYTQAAKEGAKLIRRQLRDIEWDADSMLHKVGLTTYKPAKFGFGGFSLFLLGAAAGAVVGLALAPKPGAELRTQVKDRALDLWSKAQEAQATGEIPARA